MNDICKIVKKIEKETGNPCEIKVSTANEKIKEEIYGSLKERGCAVIPAYTGDKKEIKEDAEKLKGNYENLNSIQKKMGELGFESYSRKGEERKIVAEIQQKAGEISTKKTLCGSPLLFELFELLLGEQGMISKIKIEKREEGRIKKLKKILENEVCAYCDINKGRDYMKKEFRKKNIDFLNNSYLVQDDGIYLHTADLHPGFMMGIGDKVAKIKYTLLEMKRIKGGGTGTP